MEQYCALHGSVEGNIHPTGGLKYAGGGEQMYSSISEIDERPFVDGRQPRDVPDIARGAATPPSMTKCQVGTPVRNRRCAHHLHAFKLICSRPRSTGLQCSVSLEKFAC